MRPQEAVWKSTLWYPHAGQIPGVLSSLKNVHVKGDGWKVDRGQSSVRFVTAQDFAPGSGDCPHHLSDQDYTSPTCWRIAKAKEISDGEQGSPKPSGEGTAWGGQETETTHRIGSQAQGWHRVSEVGGSGGGVHQVPLVLKPALHRTENSLRARAEAKIPQGYQSSVFASLFLKAENCREAH